MITYPDPDVAMAFLRRMQDAIVDICRENPEFDDRRMWGPLMQFCANRVVHDFGPLEAQVLLFQIAQSIDQPGAEQLAGRPN